MAVACYSSSLKSRLGARSLSQRLGEGPNHLLELELTAAILIPAPAPTPDTENSLTPCMLGYETSSGAHFQHEHHFQPTEKLGKASVFNAFHSIFYQFSLIFMRFDSFPHDLSPVPPVPVLPQVRHGTLRLCAEGIADEPHWLLGSTPASKL